MTLPSLALPPPPRSAPALHVVPPPPAARVVLVVEDDRDIREIEVELLQAEGYQTVEAENGRQALALLDRMAPPSLVLLDMWMPEMDGAEFLQHLRADVRWDGLPVVVASATQEYRPEGAAALLRKPFEADELFAVVEAQAH